MGSFLSLLMLEKISSLVPDSSEISALVDKNQTKALSLVWKLFSTLILGKNYTGEYDRDISLVEWYRTPPGTRKSTHRLASAMDSVGQILRPT